MRTVAGVLLQALGVVAIGFVEIVTLIWVFNEHGLGWTIAAFILLPSVLVLSFIAELWYGVILLVGLAFSMYGRYLDKGYWRTDEDQMLHLAAERAKRHDEEW